MPIGERAGVNPEVFVDQVTLEDTLPKKIVGSFPASVDIGTWQQIIDAAIDAATVDQNGEPVNLGGSV